MPEPWLDSELIRLRFETFLSSSSCFLTISSTISCGLRPGQVVVTVMTGRSTVGVSWTGMAPSPMRPNMTMRITPTVTPTGLLIARRTMSISALPARGARFA